jgi:hypothetical protein
MTSAGPRDRRDMNYNGVLAAQNAIVGSNGVAFEGGALPGVCVGCISPIASECRTARSRSNSFGHGCVSPGGIHASNSGGSGGVRVGTDGTLPQRTKNPAKPSNRR